MKIIHGIGVCNGIAAGKLFKYHSSNKAEISQEKIQDAPAEIERLQKARKRAEEFLKEIYKKAIQRIGEEYSLIFKFHLILLQEEEYFGEICSHILNENLNAEAAVFLATKKYYDFFSQMDDEYMRARREDIVDISKHLIRYLNPVYNDGFDQISQQAVIAAPNLLPSQAVNLDKTRVLGVLLRDGSKTSHASIILRTIKIPAVVGLGIGYGNLTTGKDVLINGTTGKLFIEPSGKAISKYRKKQREYQKLSV